MIKKLANHLPLISTILVLIISLVVITGWILDITYLKSVLPGLVSMKFNTAIILFLYSIIFLMIMEEKQSKLIKYSVNGLTLVLVLLTLTTFFQYVFKFNAGIDEMMMKETDVLVKTSHPGRMAPSTALCFSFLGLSLLLLNFTKALITARILIVLTALLALVSLIGYAYGVYNIINFGSYTEMALHTSMSFVLLVIAILFIYPDLGFNELVEAETEGGYVFRRFFPMFIFLPIALGWLRWQGEQFDFYNTETGMIIITFVFIISLIVLTLFSAKKIHKREIERNKAEEKHIELNRTLENRVEERTISLENKNKELTKALDERSVLLKEIHHRVKNNLQIISSLISLQKNNINEDYSRKLLTEAQSRINAMALVHEKLYQEKDLGSVFLDQYIETLTDELGRIYNSSKKISYDLNIDKIRLNINQMIYLGLILNEIINNSIKHAFPGDTIGTITINCHRQNGCIYIEIKDNGKPFPSGFKVEDSEGLGMKLLDSLIQQLEGEFKFNSEEKQYLINIPIKN